MTENLWSFFWGLFWKVALLVMLGTAAVAMIITSIVYEAVSVIQPLPIYEGEDVSELPDAPEGVTVSRLSPSTFFEIRASADSYDSVAETANKVAADYRDMRQSAAKEVLKARLQAVDPGSAEWLRIQKELRMPMPAIEIHRWAVPNPVPVRYKTRIQQLEDLRCWAVISGLLVAWGCTWYRRRRDPGDDAPVFPWKPWRFVALGCAATLGSVILSQQLEPKKFGASVEVEVLPDAVESFANQFEILGSHEVLKEVIGKRKLVNKWNLANDAEAFHAILRNLELRADENAQTVSVRYTNIIPNDASKIAHAVANEHSLLAIDRFRERKMLRADSLDLMAEEPGFASQREAIEAAAAAERSDAEKEHSFFQISDVSEPKPVSLDWWPVLRADGWKALVWGTLFGLFLSSWKEMRASRKPPPSEAAEEPPIEMVRDPY